MGQQSSKPAEGNAANHSSSSSNTNSRKELKAPPAPRRSHNPNIVAPSPSERASHTDNRPNTLSHSHSHPQSNPHSSPTYPRRIDDTNTMGSAHSKEKWIDERKKDKSRSAGKSTPVKVPRGSDPRRQRGPDSQFEPSGPPRDPNYIPHSNLNFPPRLPLPIEEEIHAPGSPIIPAEGFSSSLHEEDIEGPLPRQSSTISSTTLEDDALGDELQPYPYDTPRGTVPTLLQWPKEQGGEKVYVTGTFIQWSRKFRMHRDANGILSAVIQFPPGTHHVKFIVDGEMQLSKDLPTAVDFTNILVNYVEVSADDIPKQKPEQHVPPGVYPPQVLQEAGTEAKDHEPQSMGQTQLVEGEPKAEPVFWGKEVPKYLRDVDLPEHSKRYARAARGVTEFPTPPGLPLFLGKSILNGTTPMKDDSSVLNMPNHTVLNHLATSSIKNEVLATSITTRYKRKYVTTIVYKPTDSIG